MTSTDASEVAKAVVRRNTEEVQGGGNFAVFDELFADDFLDHTPQPGRTPDKAGARELDKVLRAAFPDFHADINGSSPMETGSRPTKPTTARTRASSSAWRQPVTKSSSRPWM